MGTSTRTSLVTRILPPAEYPRLADTESAEFIPLLTESSKVLVIEDDGRIVGCEIFQLILHGEGLWIHPDYRGKTSVARRLWVGMKKTVKEHFGVQWFATSAATPQVHDLLVHVGAVRVPVENYMVPVCRS